MTITEIKRALKAAGNTFFNREQICFFDTKVESKVYEGTGGIYFVTSENMRQNRREYFVKRYVPAFGKLKSAGCFSYRSGAMKRARELSKGRPDVDDSDAAGNAISLALGRIFRLCSRPFCDGDLAEFHRCRNIILNNYETAFGNSVDFTDHVPNLVRDRLKGAQGD